MPDQEDLRRLFWQGPAVVYGRWPVDPFRLSYVSGNVQRTLGYSPEQLVDGNGFWTERVHPEDRTRVLQALHEIPRPETQGLEYRFRHADGSYRWLHDEFTLPGSAEETTQEIVGYWLDITPRRAMQQELEASERLLRDVIDTSPNMIFVVDLDGRVVLANRAFSDFYGLPLAQVQGRREVDIHSQLGMPPGALEEWSADDRTVIREGRLAESVRLIHDREGTRRWRREQKLPIRLSDGRDAVLVVSEDIHRLKETEQALREERDRARLFLDVSSTVIVGLDPEGRVILANDAASRFLGCPKEELVGANWVERFIPKPDRLRVRTVHKSDLQKDRKSPQSFQNGVIAADGKVRQLLWRNDLLRDSVGRVLGTVSSGIDVTESLQAEEQHARLAAIVDTANDAIIGKTLNGTIISWNPAAERLYGYSEQEAVGRPVSIIVPSDRKDELSAILDRIAHGERVEQLQTVRRHKNGTLFDISLRVSPIKNDDGEVIGASAIGRDITRERRQAAALKESERKYRDLVENANDAIYTTDLDGRIRSSNRAAERLTGYSREEAQTLTIYDLLCEDDLKRAKALFEQTSSGQLSDTVHEFTIRRKDGTKAVVEVNWRPVVEDGVVTGTQGIARDITARREAEQRVRRAMEGSIQAVSLLVESRDPYTAGHQRRMTQLACSIARNMGLPEDRVIALRLAGLVHDIGKIAIPAEILTRPGALSKVEYQILKTHPTVAYDVLSTIEFPWPIAEIVLQHHERLDGSGYPRGLKGDDILIEARILAVADTVEAIASHRPYRDALGLDVAIDELEAARGTELDEVAVDACIKLLRSGSFRFDSDA